MDIQTDVQKGDSMGQPAASKREELLDSLASAKQHTPLSLTSMDSKGAAPSMSLASPPLRDIRSSTAQAKRSTPLAPMLPHQASISANVKNISSAPSPYGGSDVVTGAPLGLGLKDVQTSYTAPLNIKKRSSTAPASARSSQPGSPVTNVQQTALTHKAPFAALFPDFSAPELSDPGFNTMDHQGLLSPFMLASPNFSIASSSRLAASPSGTVSLPSTPLINSQTVKSLQGTPSTAPRQHFFQTGSTSSMPRFPTPDKLALGYTPSPTQFPSNLLLPPISPAVPLNTDASEQLTRSTSAGTITSESTSESCATSPSSSNLSDVLNAGLIDTVAPLPHSRNASRDGKIRREDIRESLLHFPSPPTSPRAFNFTNNHLDTSLPYAVLSLSSSKCSSAATPALSSDISSEDHSTDDDNRPSLDEIMHAQANAAAHDAEDTKQVDNQATSFAQLILPELSSFNLNMHQERTNSISLPPTSSLPPLPRSLSAHASAPSPIPPPPTRPVPAPPVASPTALVRSSSAFPGISQSSVAEPQVSSVVEATSIDLPAPSRPRLLKSSRSTESLLGRKPRSEEPKQTNPSPLQMAPSTFSAGQDTDVKISKVANRRRRASLSIKIPKFLAKLRKNDELSAPGLPPTPLNCPESRFSPDSEGPPSAARKPSLAQRLSRAVSSPNLKTSASMQDISSGKDSVFVPPASAPPVPSSFISPLLPSATPLDSALPTPGLLTDFGSSAASGSPRLTDVATKQPHVTSQQPYNPYFFAVGGISSYLIPTNDTGISQSPRSHADMQWLESQPKSVPAQPSQATKQAVQESFRSSESNSPSSSESEVPSATATGTSSNGKKGLASSQSSSRSQDDEDDDGKDRYGKSGTSSDGSDEYGDSDNEEESEDDDVPLARAHPDALQAQKSLRLKEKEGRKKVRTTRSGESKLKKGASAKAPIPPPSQSQPAAASVIRSATTRDPATRQDRPLPRKQNTMPIPARNPFGFARDELSQKLKGADLGPSRAASIKADQKRPDSGGSRPHALLLPQTDEQVKRRNKSKGKSDLAPPLAPFVQDSVLTMSEGSEDDDDDLPLQANMSLRSNSSAKQSSNGMSSLKAAKSVRSQPGQRTGSTSPTSEVAPVALAQSMGPAELAHINKPAYHCQQRIYINDPQHHSTFTIDEKTTPATILAELRSKGAISANPAYCVIEMWRTLGVERPLREYEFLQDSIESWSSDANASLFLVKKTSLAPLLSQAPQPALNSEEAGAWVHMEVKRGKWSKRWMEIRNNSVFIGKSEKPRDQTLLCTLSNFDAYQVPQACIVKLKTPKPFAFALKSVDKVTLFENADQDYVHFFSVKTEAERDQWTQRILQTRSSLVQQILTARAAVPTVDTRTNIIAQPMASQLSNTSSNLSRASSRHQSPPMPSSAVFADGSLLARAASTSSRQSGATSPTHTNPPPIPPVPSISSGNFQSIPQGRDWEKLGHEDRHRHILEAAKKAREGGQPLLDFGQQQSQLQAHQMSRAQSMGQRR